ncbi:hypothetical protein [uncultured Tenacibaculum sp.]|uniref:hypothetical protein n=1 Tax=uncultured Tenacibaculum sp. TaxID=174713 RepID=UPI0026331CA6|nr:hypothetical protein [uncultured Tenacibaculum sp.]
MKKMLFFTVLFISVFIASCGVLPKNNNFHPTNSEIELGVVGEKQKSIRKTNFETFGTPKYDANIKVSVSEVLFTKKSYKQYLNSLKNKKGIDNMIVMNDSIQSKPRYTVVKIENRVSVVNSLNKSNFEVFNYLKKSNNPLLVLSLQLIPNQEFLSLIKNSDAVYLKTDKQSKQRLFIYKDEKEIGSIDFSKQLIFGYELSSFCWKVTSRKKIEIATLINENQNCSNSTKDTPEALEKELIKSSFKF